MKENMSLIATWNNASVVSQKGVPFGAFISLEAAPSELEKRGLPEGSSSKLSDLLPGAPRNSPYFDSRLFAGRQVPNGGFLVFVNMDQFNVFRGMQSASKDGRAVAAFSADVNCDKGIIDVAIPAKMGNWRERLLMMDPCVSNERAFNEDRARQGWANSNGSQVERQEVTDEMLSRLQFGSSSKESKAPVQEVKTEQSRPEPRGPKPYEPPKRTLEEKLADPEWRKKNIVHTADMNWDAKPRELMPEERRGFDVVYDEKGRYSGGHYLDKPDDVSVPEGNSAKEDVVKADVDGMANKDEPKVQAESSGPDVVDSEPSVKPVAEDQVLTNGGRSRASKEELAEHNKAFTDYARQRTFGPYVPERYSEQDKANAKKFSDNLGPSFKIPEAYKRSLEQADERPARPKKVLKAKDAGDREKGRAEPGVSKVKVVPVKALQDPRKDVVNPDVSHRMYGPGRAPVREVVDVAKVDKMARLIADRDVRAAGIADGKAAAWRERKGLSEPENLMLPGRDGKPGARLVPTKFGEVVRDRGADVSGNGPSLGDLSSARSFGDVVRGYGVRTTDPDMGQGNYYDNDFELD
ncbi:MAG: hypothetical protein HDQ88_12200 [Clostridia bacterium]|nr:hypothetical protein [Clostridia bacterium]